MSDDIQRLYGQSIDEIVDRHLSVKRQRLWGEFSESIEEKQFITGTNYRTAETQKTIKIQESKNVNGSTTDSNSSSSESTGENNFCKDEADVENVQPQNAITSHSVPIDSGMYRDFNNSVRDLDGPHSDDVGGVSDTNTGVSFTINYNSVGEPWCRIFAAISQHKFRPYLVHDTIYYSDDQEREQLVQQFIIKDRQCTTFTNIKYQQPLVVADHQLPGYQHIHVFHDCNWTARTCSCSRHSWYKRNNAFRKPTRIRKMSGDDWVQLISYLCRGHRCILQIRVGREIWRHPIGYTCVSDESNRGNGTEGLVDEIINEGSNCRAEHDARSTYRSNIPRNAESGPKNHRRLHRESQCSGETSEETIQGIIDVIKNNGNCPLEKVFRVNVWLEHSKYMYLRPSDRIVDTAISKVKLELNKWLTVDFINHYYNTDPLFFASCVREREELYMSVDESIEKLFRLLMFQFVKSAKVREFLQTCFDVCDKRSGKRNAIFIVGDSNAGKTQFADTLTAYYLNRGELRNPTKSERFSFQECADRRIILWDEAKLDPGNYDNIKRLLAGDHCKVAVKFKEDQVVMRTPIIVCSNNSIFPKNDEFHNRLISYRWHTYPFWSAEDVNKKFNPLGLGLMLCWAGKVENMIFNNVRKHLYNAKCFIRKNDI